MKGNKRILIFNVNWLGDVLFSTPAIRAIRRNFPDSFIACIIPGSCYPILKGNPHLDEVIIFDDKDRHGSFLAQLEFVKQLKKKQFDTVFLLHRSLTRALICRLAGIPQRVGYHTKKRAFLLTKSIATPKKDTMHRIDYYLNVLEKAGLKIEDRYTEFFVAEEEGKFVDSFLKKQGVKENEFLAVLNPGGNWLPKRWPVEYWARLADRLVVDFGARVVISGGPNDRPLALSVREKMREKPVVTCGVFNIKQLGALCRRSDLFITADTGPLHIANAVGAKKVVALFGPTSPEITGPYPCKNVKILRKETGCKIPCYVAHCENNRCMKVITPEDVIEAIK